MPSFQIHVTPINDVANRPQWSVASSFHPTCSSQPTEGFSLTDSTKYVAVAALLKNAAGFIVVRRNVPALSRPHTMTLLG
jgi:hypothetical protein